MTLWGSASVGTLEEFKTYYQPGDALRRNGGGRTLLCEALGNTDAVNRFAIASFLLDEGADPTWRDRRAGGNLLHFLLNHVRAGFADTDMVLLQRLLDGGADVNESDKRVGTPLQLANRYAAEGEFNVLPVYDVLFACDDLDLFSPGRFGFSTYDTAWKGREYYPVFWQRVRQYVADHGLQVPESERVEE